MATDQNKEILNVESKARATAGRISYFDMVVESAKGAIVTDANGREYYDLLASASAINVGHCHPKVVSAVKEQADKLLLYTPAYFSNVKTAELYSRLAAITPGNFAKKVALGNSGSDANDAMIKFARAYTGRQYIVSYTGAYHGSTYGAMSVSGVSLNMTRKMGPMVPGVVKVPYPDHIQRHKGESDHDYSVRMFQLFKLPFDTYLPADETAMVLIEPIQGDGGIVKPPQEYMDMVYQFTRENGIVFAVDEVNQGLGRTGKMWSIDHFGIEPDLMAIGKSVASGLPLSAVVGRAEMIDALQSPGNAYTTAGNPVAAATALATLDVIEEENLVQRSKDMGERAEAFFKRCQQDFSFIGAVRMYGFNGGVDIVDENGNPDPDATNRILYRMYELGAIMISLRGNTLRFQPPLVMTDDEWHHASAIILQAFVDEKDGMIKEPDAAGHIGWS
ncbi:aspartate aminotransferase family protein [Fructobacillus sp. M2-14]|uniref:Aspartate aminotransferase family protein n=1 Tax=Fructobacillus broussonetiae TaxID=2713173 RepID=A0ABS5R035_9LACO|nr:aspartate aminotransferase family protein [Fructobacillus broussonetiae]MBS9338809.1 aspartate aminotransferase family protein [Fructobacillus broussonetiae]